MINRQPTTKAQGSWQRKLATTLLAGVLSCLPINAANAFITDTVVASGTNNGLPIQASATANVDVVDSAPALTLVKTGTLNDGGDGSADPGDSISYTFTITNTGNVTLQNVSIIDPTAILTGTPIPTMAPGATDTLTFTANHILTATDVASGQYTNTAVATATTADAKTATAGAFANTPLNFASAMSFIKSGVLDLGLNGRADAGDQITYSFKVTNTGPTPLNNVTVTDPLVMASLPGRERMVALLDASQISSDPISTASIDAASSRSSGTYAPNATAVIARQTAIHEAPQITANLNVTRQLVRMSPDNGPLIAGDKIGFIFGLYNTGDVPLTTINVDQPGSVAFGDSLNILASNAQDGASVIFTRNVTAEEIAAGEITDPSIITAHARGQVIVQKITGSVPLSTIQPYDSFASASITPASVANLNAGQSTTFTAIYILTQADLDAGVVNNTATAKAKNLLDQTLTQVSSFQQTLVPVPGVALVKGGNVNLGPDGVASIGDIVTYRFDVTNTGNVTLTNVGVTDLPGFTVTGIAIPSIAPGITNSSAFTATHALVQADLDAGKVTNQATASGTSPTSVVVTDLSDPISVTGNAPTIVSLAPAPAIALIKSVNPVVDVIDVNGNGRNDAGDKINYHFKVKNTGNQTLTNVIVTDPKITVIGAPIASMNPGDEDDTHFTGTYTITLADMDLGHVDNTARVDGTAPGPVNVFDLSDPGVFTQTAPTITPLVQKPQIALVKKQDPIIDDINGNGVTDKGDVIHYTFTLFNIGNVTLDNVTVTDNLPLAVVSGTPMSNYVPNDPRPGNYTATYTITDADVAAGQVSNLATASATSKTGTLVTDLSDNSNPTLNNPTITPILVKPAIKLIKEPPTFTDTTGDGKTGVGDTLNYKFQIKNTGNVTLTDVYVTDPLATVTGAHITSLNAGSMDTTTFTASYILTQADIDAGKFTNQAKVQGTFGGNIFSDLSDNSNFTGDNPTIAILNSGIALVKKETLITDTNNNGLNDAGDIINYAFIVTNTGAGTLNNVTITDPNGIVTINGSTPFSLAAGVTDATHFTATHVITKADVLASGVTNQARVDAISLITNTAVTDKSDNTSIFSDNPTFTPLSQVPSVALIKTIKGITDTNGSGVTDVGDVITYAFSVVNTGNVDLTNLVLTDANAVLSPNPATLPSLATGATDSTTFSATHLVTVADAVAGQVSNSAVIDAKTPTGSIVSDVSDNTGIAGARPTITPIATTQPVLTKTAAKSEVKRGETVQYTITASNLVGGPFQLTDIMPPGFAYLAGSAAANGIAVTPTVNVRNLDFKNLSPASGKIILKLKLLASTTLGGGKFVNNAHLIDPATGKVIATAQAIVTITDEAVFDCSDIIGRVFDDKNANGYMDDGEPGLPGVRLVTLNGVLITTDSQGRYHVPCAAIPDSAIGSNFLMKLDVRTLPTGYKLTTENPRDVRVTRGKVVKLNFGASILREVRLDVTGKAFDPNSTDLTEKWALGIDRLLDVLSKNRSTLKIVYHRGGESEELAQARVSAVEDTVTLAWKNGNGAYHLVTTTSVEDGK
jgi:uncharacterized repeat protein (TIGR01451 family)